MPPQPNSPSSVCGARTSAFRHCSMHHRIIAGAVSTGRRSSARARDGRDEPDQADQQPRRRILEEVVVGEGVDEDREQGEPGREREPSVRVRGRSAGTAASSTPRRARGRAGARARPPPPRPSRECCATRSASVCFPVRFEYACSKPPRPTPCVGMRSRDLIPTAIRVARPLVALLSPRDRVVPQRMLQLRLRSRRSRRATTRTAANANERLPAPDDRGEREDGHEQRREARLRERDEQPEPRDGDERQRGERRRAETAGRARSARRSRAARRRGSARRSRGRRRRS